jgi:amidase
MGNIDDRVGAFVRYEAVNVAHAPDGPLAGLSLAVKDIYDVAGYPTGCGNPIKQAESPIHRTSAPIVQRMLDAGAEFAGKTNTDELAFSLNGQNMHTGSPVNVRAPGRITGGSSSGSAAAMAAGLCDLALGSDTGGSVRAPASYCGLFGIRPSHGRVSLEKVMPLAPSYDVAGYFADDAALFERAAPVFLGDDGQDFSLTRPLRADDAFAQLMSDREAKALGGAERQVAALLGGATSASVAEDGLDDWYWVFRQVQAFEAWQCHGAWIEAHDPKMTPGVRERFEFGRDLATGDVENAKLKRAAMTARLEEMLGSDGVLVLPTVPSIAPKRDAGEDLQAFRERALAILCISGNSGLPQVSMPLAMLDDCPFGLSLIGPRGSDRALVALAAAIAGNG